jgi:DNA-binding YbaB/EbfC family protein
MGSGFAKMKKQAREMEAQMELLKKQLKDKIIEGKSGNGLVTVTLDGERNVKSIKIKPECVDPSDIEGLEDLILAAFQDAAKQSETDSSLGMPSNFPFPF